MQRSDSPTNTAQALDRSLLSERWCATYCRWVPQRKRMTLLGTEPSLARPNASREESSHRKPAAHLCCRPAEYKIPWQPVAEAAPSQSRLYNALHLLSRARKQAVSSAFCHRLLD